MFVAKESVPEPVLVKAPLPLMIPLTWSGTRAVRWLERPGLRWALGLLVLLAGLLTLAAPWLMHVPGMHGLLAALGCRSLPG